MFKVIITDYTYQGIVSTEKKKAETIIQTAENAACAVADSLYSFSGQCKERCKGRRNQLLE